MKDKGLKHWAAVLLVLLFCLFRLSAFITNPLLPDEVWHTGIMRDLVGQNSQAMGAAYWLLGFYINYVVGDEASIHVYRGLAGFVMLLGPLAAYRLACRTCQGMRHHWCSRPVCRYL